MPSFVVLADSPARRSATVGLRVSLSLSLSLSLSHSQLMTMSPARSPAS
jgi:hypothetical protein